MTSFHDTTVSDLNCGFKEATLHFNKITADTQQILKATSDNHDIKTILKMMESTAGIMQNVVEEISDDAWTIIELTVAGVTIIFIIIQTAVLIKLNRDIKLSVAEIKNYRS